MKYVKRLIKTLLAALLAVPQLGQAATGEIHRGTVISVIDAQTVRVARQGGGELRVRLPKSLGENVLRSEYQGQPVVIREGSWDKGLLYGDFVQASN